MPWSLFSFSMYKCIRNSLPNSLSDLLQYSHSKINFIVPFVAILSPFLPSWLPSECRGEVAFGPLIILACDLYSPPTKTVNYGDWKG